MQVAVGDSDVDEDVVVVEVVPSPSQVRRLIHCVSVTVSTVEVDTPLLSVKYSVRIWTFSMQDAIALVVHSPSSDPVGLTLGVVVGVG